MSSTTAFAGRRAYFTVVATAHSQKSNRGTDEEEPMLLTVQYGKGRVFHTTLGHDVAAMECVAYRHVAARHRVGRHRQSDAEGSQGLSGRGSAEPAEVVQPAMARAVPRRRRSLFAVVERCDAGHLHGVPKAGCRFHQFLGLGYTLGQVQDRRNDVGRCARGGGGSGWR